MHNWWKILSFILSLVVASCSYTNAFDEIVAQQGTSVDPCENTECDNCPDDENPGQEDYNLATPEGAACEDSDDDGILDQVDNCVFTANPATDCYYSDIVGPVFEQCDIDADLDGDACDCDVDDDQYNNTELLGVLYGPGGAIDVCVFGTDNCDEIANPDQDDHDGDFWGDICDDCPASPGNDEDQDNVCEPWDNCPTFYNPPSDCDLDPLTPVEQCDLLDENGEPNPDGIGDVCQRFVDYDGDGIPDFDDICPLNWNPSQSDIDDDGLGDGLDGNGNLTESYCDQFPCDSRNDIDDDWSPDLTIDPSESPLLCSYVGDNCREFPNPCQTDTNHNGLGDVCEDVFQCQHDSDCGDPAYPIPANFSWGCLMFADYSECGSCYDPDSLPAPQDMVCNYPNGDESLVYPDACADGYDNDGDRLRDCEDPDCANAANCFCVTDDDCDTGMLCNSGNCEYPSSFGDLDVVWTRDTGMTIPSEVVRIRLEVRCWDSSFNLVFSPGIHEYGDPTDLTLTAHVEGNLLNGLDLCWFEIAGLDGLEFQADTLVIWHAIPFDWAPVLGEVLGGGENGTMAYTLGSIDVDPTGIGTNNSGGYVWGMEIGNLDWDLEPDPDDPCPQDALDNCSVIPPVDGECNPVPPTPLPAPTPAS